MANHENDPNANRKALELNGADDKELMFLSTCQEIYRRHGGTVSPFEEFIYSLIFQAQSGHWPTPEDVEFRLVEFRIDFEIMTRHSRAFAESYPKVLALTDQAIQRPQSSSGSVGAAQ